MEATMHRKTILASLMALFLLASVWAFGKSGDKAKAKGMIISRTGETLIVRGGQRTVTVIINDETKTQDKKGLFGLDKEHMSQAVLIPGLKVDVDGLSDDQGRVVAKTITVDGDDLETAEMIQAGLHPTAEQVIANEQKAAANAQGIETNRQNIEAHKQEIETSKQNIAAHQQQIEKNIKDIEENTNRFTSLSEYDLKGQATLRFQVGSSEISAQDQEQLKELAQNAVKFTGYIIEVTGYTDSTGTAAINQQLSEDRAKAVIAYLIQQCGVPLRHVVAPGAMGMYQPAASNETPSGRAENRRVEVKVLLNKGIAGK
jgi:outer membrane protein OmpA-like peptidoglycan-associated protein